MFDKTKIRVNFILICVLSNPKLKHNFNNVNNIYIIFSTTLQQKLLKEDGQLSLK